MSETEYKESDYRMVESRVESRFNNANTMKVYELHFILIEVEEDDKN